MGQKRWRAYITVTGVVYMELDQKQGKTAAQACAEALGSEIDGKEIETLLLNHPKVEDVRVGAIHE